MQDFQLAVFRGMLDVLYGIGAHRWMAPATRGRGAIFMLHHVRPPRSDAFAPNSFLEVTPGFLDRVIQHVKDAGVDLVSLDEVGDRLSAPKGGRSFATFTLDDGYLDNAEYAAPVFRKHACPYALYVPSDFVDGEGVLWWAVLEEAIRRVNSLRVTLQGRREKLETATTSAKAEAFSRIYAGLRGGSDSSMEPTIRNLAAQAGFVPEEVGRNLCLDWDELVALATDPLLTIGSHTRSHRILAKLDADTARQEIVAGRVELEYRLGRKIEHFSYPVGDHSSAGPRDFAIVRELGFKTAVTTRRGVLYAEHAAHLEALPRVSLNGHFQADRYVDLFLSGVPFALFNGFRKVDVL
jgi:peptidoglycan/xylan/chitin deacetylase (PgdA/CDA1 family)